MTFQEQQINSKTFQAWKMKFLSFMTFKTLLQEYYIQIALYWIIWYWSLNYTYGVVEEIRLPVITAFSSKVKIKYETEKYICVKTNNMGKFNKKWALPLDSVP